MNDEAARRAFLGAFAGLVVAVAAAGLLCMIYGHWKTAMFTIGVLTFLVRLVPSKS